MMDSTKYKLLMSELMQRPCKEKKGGSFSGNYFQTHVPSPISLRKHPAPPRSPGTCSGSCFQHVVITRMPTCKQPPGRSFSLMLGPSMETRWPFAKQEVSQRARGAQSTHLAPIFTSHRSPWPPSTPNLPVSSV